MRAGAGPERIGLEQRRGTATGHHAGIDVPLERSGTCPVDGTGKILRAAEAASEPEAPVTFLQRLGGPVARIGPGAGPPSRWPHAGPTRAGLAARLPGTRPVKAALSATGVETDREDARGIARLLRMGRSRPVRRASPAARGIRAPPIGRKPWQGKPVDVELGIRGIPRGLGLKLGAVSQGRLAARPREPIGGQPVLERAVEPMPRARGASHQEARAPHRAMPGIVRHGTVCRRSRTAPGAGALAALTFATAVDGPARFRRSRAVGARCGLTPEKHRSGEAGVAGAIRRIGGPLVRAAPHEAAPVLLAGTTRSPRLKRRAREVARRRGLERAKVALARKPAAVPPRPRATGRASRFGREAAAARWRSASAGRFLGPGGDAARAPRRSRRRDVGSVGSRAARWSLLQRSARLGLARRLPSEGMR